MYSMSTCVCAAYSISGALQIILLSCCMCAFCVVPPNILDIESTPSSVAVRENQNINMTCRADGFPTPKIIWRREDGEAITIDRKRKGERELVK